MSWDAERDTAGIDRRIAALIAVLTFAFFWWVWGAWAPLPVGSDESAYLLQARIFASGRLVAAARPFPEFFWQYHVFVDPVLAAKYPPGHSALLAVGELGHAPWIIPLFAASLSSALLFLLTARWSSRSVGLIAVALAITSETSLRFWPSYFSETTTAALFLIGWLALANYWQRGRMRWLLLLAFAVGLGAITRPLTMLAFALPASIAALASMRRNHSWRHLPAAAFVTLAVVGTSFLWNERVTGSWRRSPHTEYARRFIPSDRIGFGVVSTAPADSLPPELRAFDAGVQRIHSQHTLASLPRTILARASSIARETWPYLGFAGLFALISVIALPLGVWAVAVGTIVTVFAAYLFYAHLASWTLYYLELEAPLAALTAIGVQVFAQRAGLVLRRFVRPGVGTESIQRAVFGTTAIVLLLPNVVVLGAYRGAHQDWPAASDALDRAVASIKETRALVFVKEDMLSHPERSVVQNVVDLSDAPILFAHDLGARDSLLISSLGRRTAFMAAEEHSGDVVRFRLDRVGVKPDRGSPGSGTAEGAARK